MTAIRMRASRGLRVGDCFEVRRTFSAAEVQAFADLSRDYNPVHLLADMLAEGDPTNGLASADPSDSGPGMASGSDHSGLP